MDFNSYFEFWGKVISFIPFNFFDLIIFIVFLLYVFEDATFGLLPAGIGFFSTLLAFFIGLAFYHPVSEVLVERFKLTKGIADAISFSLVTLVSFTIISSVLTIIRRKYINITFSKKINVIGGAVFGSISFFFIASFVVALLLSFPIANPVKNSIKDSFAGGFLSAQTRGFEGYVRQIFGGAIDDTINFLTIKPDSNEAVNLNFSLKDYKVDPDSEKKMLDILNLERRKKGLSDLVMDDVLISVARNHAKDMIERGYFSHYTIEGLSPFERMENAGVFYQYAGENLAFAPDAQIAMDGLMKSKGHRENILSDKFNKIGIGVIDAGVYGEMFVQEFTD